MLTLPGVTIVAVDPILIMAPSVRIVCANRFSVKTKTANKNENKKVEPQKDLIQYDDFAKMDLPSAPIFQNLTGIHNIFGGIDMLRLTVM